jgi:hypothetical protein
MTLAEYRPQWLATARLRGLRATTLVGYAALRFQTRSSTCASPSAAFNSSF